MKKLLTLLFLGIFLAVFPKASYADYSCTGQGVTSSGGSCSRAYCSDINDSGRLDINACGTSSADSITCTNCGKGTCNESTGLCNSITPSPTLTPTPTPTLTPTPTPTSTRIPTQTPFFTRTPPPSSIPTSTIAFAPPTIPPPPLTNTASNEWGDCAPDGVATISCIPKVLGLVINGLLLFGGVIGLFILILGSFKYIGSKGDPKAYESAKNTILYGIIGLLIVFLSFFILNFISYVTRVGCITKIGFGC